MNPINLFVSPIPTLFLPSDAPDLSPPPMLSPPSDPVSGQCPTGQTSPSAALGFGSHHCTCDCVLDCRNNSGLDCFLTVSFSCLVRGSHVMDLLLLLLLLLLLRFSLLLLTSDYFPLSLLLMPVGFCFGEGGPPLLGWAGFLCFCRPRPCVDGGGGAQWGCTSWAWPHFVDVYGHNIGP